VKGIKSKRKRQFSYIPDPALVDFLKERLHLLEKQRAGKKLALEDSKLKRKNDRRKVYALNTNIFPSMANLIAFFESIRKSPELQVDFEDEIEELLMGWNKNDKHKTDAFSRLVNGATGWDYDKDPFNFRLSLLFQMQKAITTKIPIYAKHDFDKEAGPFGISENIVKPDMERAFAWAGFYARNTLNSETQKEWENVSRPVLF
jgi:hypothetical protein